MSEDRASKEQEFKRRVTAEMLDSFDEELEMEIDDERMNDLVTEATSPSQRTTDLDRRFYFKELFRLQGELVKLQDWVVHKKLKLVVLFEGRDLAQARYLYVVSQLRLKALVQEANDQSIASINGWLTTP